MSTNIQNMTPSDFLEPINSEGEVLTFDKPVLEPLLTVDQFKLYEAKDCGVSSGGIYKDHTGHKWLLKEPQWGDLENGINEYIAGAIFQQLLGPYAPRTELVFNQQNGEIMLGSKFLDNFQTLDEFDRDNWMDPISLRSSHQGKPIKNLCNVISAVKFCNDVDAHKGNVGIMEEDNAWNICKIDHGYAFQQSYSEMTLADYKEQFSWYGGRSLSDIGFKEVYDSIKMVADINYDEIEDIVNEKTEHAKRYTALWEKFHQMKSPVDLNKMRQSILNLLKKQLKSFRKIVDYLDLEKAIIRDDASSITKLIQKGFDLKKSFSSFFCDNTWEEVSPLGLAQSRHSLKACKVIEDALGAANHTQPQPVVFRNMKQNTPRPPVVIAEQGRQVVNKYRAAAAA